MVQFIDCWCRSLLILEIIWQNSTSIVTLLCSVIRSPAKLTKPLVNLTWHWMIKFKIRGDRFAVNFTQTTDHLLVVTVVMVLMINTQQTLSMAFMQIFRTHSFGWLHDRHRIKKRFDCGQVAQYCWEFNKYFYHCFCWFGPGSGCCFIYLFKSFFFALLCA